MSDRLQELFDRQKKLAANFIPIESISSEEDRSKYLQTYWQLLVEEAVEFLREIPSRKFWRATSAGKKIDYDKLHEELSDIQHIVVALALISGLDADSFFNEYVRKNDINLNRVAQKL